MNTTDLLAYTSFVLALISVITVVLTLRQNSKMIEASTRPVICIYSDEINSGAPQGFFVIRNYGASSATIQEFSFDYDFSDCYVDGKGEDWLKELQGAVLAPHQSRLCLMDISKVDKPVTFTIKYKSAAGKEYSEKQIVNLQAGTMVSGKVQSNKDELHNISYTLQEMLQKQL